MRLAIVTSHPIQYYAPWFKYLSNLVDLHVYYMFKQETQGQDKNEFGVSFKWDVDLLEGYNYTFLKNVSKNPSVNSFKGCDVPDLGKALKEGGFDAALVLGWYLKGFWQAIISCKKYEIPILVRGDSKINKDQPKLKTIVKKMAFPFMFKLFDKILYVGENNKKYLEFYGAPKYKLAFCPHFVHQDFFVKNSINLDRDNLVKKMNLKRDSFKLLFVGKFIDKKRPLDILKALRLIQKDTINIELLLVGSGILKKELIQYCQVNNLVSIHFLGFKNQSELPAIYKISDALILPSKGDETWGLVVNEAFSILKPAIVSDEVGCAPDLIAEGLTGEIFEVGNIDDMVAKIKKMITYAKEEEEEEVQKHILEKNKIYSIENASNNLIKVIQSL